MNPNDQTTSSPPLERARRALLHLPGSGMLLLVILLTSGVRLRAQTPAPRLFSAQTGWNEITFVWDSVPGALEYRIYVMDANVAGPPDITLHPLTSTSASGRRAQLSGIQRFVGRTVYLVAVSSDRQVLFQAPFAPVVRVTALAPITQPTNVRAQETGATQVTLTWTPVAGATAYMLGRSVGPSGLARLCDLCPPTGQFVDDDATPGLAHSYTVQAVFPNGVSRRVESNIVTPGAAQVATPGGVSSGAGQQPPAAGNPPSNNPPVSNPPSTGAPVTPPTPASLMPPTQVNATVAGVASGSAWLTWQASPSAGVTGYTIYRNIDGGAFSAISSVGGTTYAYMDQVPASQFNAAAIQAAYYVVARGGNAVSANSNTTNAVSIQRPIATPQPPATTTPTVAMCKLDYKRADNMFAAYGRPDGNLGTETISLPDGQTKVFVTDWKYEKQTNDGTNYYGSHLRVATNAGATRLRLQVRTTWLTTIKSFVSKLAGNRGDLYLDPGKTILFQADLMEVHCGT